MKHHLLDKITHCKDSIKDFQDLIEKFWEQFKTENPNLSFDDLFDAWYEYAPKTYYSWFENIEPENELDIWDYLEPYDKGRIYTIKHFLDYLDDLETDKTITLEAKNEYKKILMEKNVGSIIYDW